MFIRWTFVINDKPVAVEVRDDNEDKRIADAVQKENCKLLFIAGKDKDAYVNLSITSVILREVVEEIVAPEPEETKAE